MAQGKRSFFERLTGAVRLEDEVEQVAISTRREERPVASHTDSYEDREEEAQLTVDVYETPTEIIIKTMVAGVKPDDLDVSITRDSVTIRGERREDRTVSEGDYIHKELYWGAFSRTIDLPKEVDVDEAEALEKFGMLILRLPRLDKNRQTKLKVKGI